MFNEFHSCEIKAVSAKVIERMIEGLKLKEGVFSVTIASCDIGWDEISELSPYIPKMLQCEPDMLFKTVDFGDLSSVRITSLMMKVFEPGTDREITEVFEGVKITNLKVENDGNIPVYVFKIQVPKNNGNFLLTNLQNGVQFNFIKNPGLFDNIKDVKVTVKGV
jgi:hypothetical protein